MNAEKQAIKKRMKAEAFNFLREKFYPHEDGDGTFSQEIYADYRDVMEDKTAAEICESDDPRQAFEEKMYEWFDGEAYDLCMALLNELEDDMKASYPNGFSEEEREILQEILMAKPKGFLESMRVELVNLPSCMSTVTFLAQMTLEQLISVNAALHYRARNHSPDAKSRPNCGYVLLGKETMTGLFNPWSGAGSVLEVELEKDVRLPPKFIGVSQEMGRWGLAVLENR